MHGYWFGSIFLSQRKKSKRLLLFFVKKDQNHKILAPCVKNSICNAILLHMSSERCNKLANGYKTENLTLMQFYCTCKNLKFPISLKIVEIIILLEKCGNFGLITFVRLLANETFKTIFWFIKFICVRLTSGLLFENSVFLEKKSCLPKR